MNTTTIRKWGNSYAVRLPKGAMNRLRLYEGQLVHFEEAQDGETISLIPARKENLSIEKMVSRITKKNQHTECAWGAPVGKEIW